MFYAEDFLIGKEPTEHEKCCHVSVCVRHWHSKALVCPVCVCIVQC